MKRFYIVLFSVLVLSVLLLGFSFSKESGSNELYFLNEETNKDYRVVYSNGNILNTVNNSSTMISFINLKNDTTDVVVTLKEKGKLIYKNVFYRVNNGPEHVLADTIINLGTLNPYGEDGDHRVFNLQVYTKDDTEYNFEILINGQVRSNSNGIGNAIKLSNSVYTDSKNNVRYYGVEVNNYILYKDTKYRIIGIIDGKVKIISDILGLGVYDTTKGEYATLEDYLGSYNNVNVNINNVLEYKSWINDRGFWLNDSVNNQAYFGSITNGLGLYNKNVDFYLRYVYYLDVNSLVKSGDGSINSPYEVAYGS